MIRRSPGEMQSENGADRKHCPKINENATVFNPAEDIWKEL